MCKCLQLAYRNEAHQAESFALEIYLLLFSAQSCLTLCNPMDCSPPGSVQGILQARILEWDIPFSRGSSPPKSGSPALQADYLPSEPPGKPLEIYTEVFMNDTVFCISSI